MQASLGGQCGKGDVQNYLAFLEAEGSREKPFCLFVSSLAEHLFVDLINDDGREQQGLRVFKILCDRVCFRAAAEILNPTGRIYDVSVRTAQCCHIPHPYISCLWHCL